MPSKKKSPQNDPVNPPAEEEVATSSEQETPQPDPIPEPSSDDEAKPSEFDVLKDRLLRLQADFDNYRKRHAREFLETRASMHKDVLEALLTPLDHLDHALASMEKSIGNGDPNFKGVKLIQAELQGVLDKFGLQRMETMGKEFDPMLHEALGTLPATKDIPDGHVVAEVRAGYTLNGKTLRAAQVMVAQAVSSNQ